MKMVSLQLPKEKTEKPEMSGISDVYPYNTRLEFTNDYVRKFKCFDDCEVGDQVAIKAIGTITLSSAEDRRDVGTKKVKKNRRVTIQLTDMAIEPDEEGEMASGFEDGSSEE